MTERDPDCVFCKIVSGELPTAKVYEDEEILVFEDRAPQAPVHDLVIPKKHIPTADAVSDEDVGVVGRMFLVARKIAREKNIVDPGYRLVVNVNQAAGQLVFHIHIHLLGGRQLGPIG